MGHPVAVVPEDGVGEDVEGCEDEVDGGRLNVALTSSMSTLVDTRDPRAAHT